MLPSIATIDKSVAVESLSPSWTVYLNLSIVFPEPAINWALASLDKHKLASRVISVECFPQTGSLNVRDISIVSPIPYTYDGSGAVFVSGW